MKNVYLAQFSTVSLDTYYFFPYSVGLIQSYAKSIPIIAKNYNLKPLLWKKLPIDQLVNSLDNPAVFGFSSYVWNANYNLQLAKAVKSKYPDCVIVFGGPGVPDADSDFFFEVGLWTGWPMTAWSNDMTAWSSSWIINIIFQDMLNGMRLV